MVISSVGDIDFSKLIRFVENYFGGLSGETVPFGRDGKEVVRVDGISLDKEQSDEHTVTLEKFPTLETVCSLSRK